MNQKLSLGHALKSINSHDPDNPFILWEMEHKLQLPNNVLGGDMMTKALITDGWKSAWQCNKQDDHLLVVALEQLVEPGNEIARSHAVQWSHTSATTTNTTPVCDSDPQQYSGGRWTD